MADEQGTTGGETATPQGSGEQRGRGGRGGQGGGGRGSSTIVRLAASTALRTASETSLALPVAMPTLPLPSPTATSCLLYTSPSPRD